MPMLSFVNFIGGTIHDVAQVVGAGYSLSTAAGDTATVVKLMRVAMLLPVIALTVTLMRAPTSEATSTRPPLLPWFVVAFAALVVVNSLGWIPRPVAAAGTALSGWYDPSGTPGLSWLHKLAAHFDRSAWLNPEPPSTWRANTIELVRKVFPMYPLTLEGLSDAVTALTRAARR